MRNRFRYIVVAMSLLACIFCPEIISGQMNVHDMDTRTRSFSPRFRTITACRDGNDQLPPVITLGSNEHVVISFDEFAEERSYLRYSIVHCNADWIPDGLVTNEFLDGFNEGRIEDYAYSKATLTHFVNYTVVIPNQEMSPLISGNYLMRVYPEDNPDDTLLQARFMVSEDAVKISGDVTGNTDIDYRDANQQVSFAVEGRDKMSLDDLSNRLYVRVRQNGRDDNAVVISHPQYVLGESARYEHLRQLIFPASNEYRRFETVSTLYPSMGVEEIAYADPFYHFRLFDDMPRRDSGYAYDRTQTGRFRVRNYDSDDPALDADYVVVHFTLRLPEGELPGADIYIEGDLTDRIFDTQSRMRYDSSEGVYRQALLLKQGAYNYQYVSVPRGKAAPGATKTVEGDFYQTDNEYTIEVYYRKPGARYDRLLGVGWLYGLRDNRR